MSGLLGLLDLGSSAFQAQNAGVAVSGRNIANINTDGYSREDVNLNSEPGSPLIGGVSVDDPSRSEDTLLAGRERQAAGSSGMADAQAAALGSLETDLTGQGMNVAQAVGDFFGAAGRLSGSPAEANLRQDVIEKAKALSKTLQDAAQKVAKAQAEANQRIADYAKQATKLAQQVAQANKALANSNDPILKDQRDQAAKQLAQITGGQARVDADGKMRVTVGGGAVLVDGDKAAAMQAVGDPTDPTSVKVKIVSDATHSYDVTSRLDGGKIAGELAFRDGTAKQAADDLDGLAYDLATQVNGVHAANAGLDGKIGRNLFNQPLQKSGAAAAMAIDPGVAANTDLLATAAPGEGKAGTGGIQALVTLGDANAAGGSQRTFSDEGVRLLASIGSAAASATASRTGASAAVQSLASLRDSVSGVSQEDELAKLAAFQHAAQAATKFVATINDMLTNMITTI